MTFFGLDLTAGPRRLGWALLAAALCGGCASVTNPTAEGVPVRRVPRELLAPSHACDVPLPFQLLRRPTPDVYRLAPGDVVAVYVEGFLGGQPPPFNPAAPVPRDQRRQQASTGYPVPVESDGTIILPAVGPVRVAGLTPPEARQAVLSRYVARKLLKDEDAVVLVSLLQQRLASVLVLRQEATAFTSGPNGIIFANKRGLGFELELGGYENDVLHALARTGGLPGVDACEEVVIQKACFRDGLERSLLMQAISGKPTEVNPLEAMRLPGPIVRIPLRLPPGTPPPPIRPEHVELQTGDVVFVPACPGKVFYTGGLLPPGEYQIPPDRELDVVSAVSYVRGALINGAFGGSNLSGQLLQQGVGNPSPSLLTVVRKTPNGGQLPIAVDLNVALCDPRERILVQPGDLLILQEKPSEALTRYFTQTFFNFNLAWAPIQTSRATGILDVSGVDRLPGRLSNVTYNKILPRQ
jgi:hypothetical protein